jgi:proteasome lid subunit RPN8/RPN11
MEITSAIHIQILDHAGAMLPDEACGLLAGQDGRVDRFYPIRNVDPEPAIRFELDPKEYLRAMEEIEGSDRQLLATFHSHTHTTAYPSPTDVEKSEGIQRFFPQARFVLVSLQNGRPELRAFTIVGTDIAEQEVRIV